MPKVKIQCTYEGEDSDISWFIERLSEIGAEDIEEIEEE